MKKCWKIALAAVAIGGLIPYHQKKDEETGASVMQAHFWSYAKKPDGDTVVNIGLHLGKMPLPTANEEEVEPITEPEAPCVEEIPVVKVPAVETPVVEVPVEAL